MCLSRFSLIASEIFQLTNRYRYQFVAEAMTDICTGYDGYFKHKENNPTYDPWNPKGNEKMQFLLLLLLALTF